MKLHANARTCPKSRYEMVRRFLAGRSREILAAEFAVSTRTVSKWVARYRAEGELGLLDRSSTPDRIRRTDADRVEAIATLRRLRFSGPEIAELLDVPLSTTAVILKRQGLGRLGRLGLEPARRYERARPGELIHIDVKSSVASRCLATASMATAARADAARPTRLMGGESATPAGSSCTSPSMTPRGWPTPKS
jgi:transposase